MKKSAFTLIEILIVLVIVSILMMMVMAFGGQFVRDIQARQIREERVSDLEMIRGKMLLTRQYEGTKIDELVISFGGEDDTDMMVTTTSGSDDDDGSTTYSYNLVDISGPTITIIPYELACTIEGNNEIQLSYTNSNKTYCYHIDKPTCKLSRIECTEDSTD